MNHAERKKDFFIWMMHFRPHLRVYSVEEQMNSMRVERVRETENAIAVPGNQCIRGLTIGARLRRLRLRAIARRRSDLRFHKAEVSTLRAERLARSIA
jgi:hypothetical protein